MPASQNIGWPIRIEELRNRFKTNPKHLEISGNTESALYPGRSYTPIPFLLPHPNHDSSVFDGQI